MKRSGWFQYADYVELGVGKSSKSCLTVWGYEKGDKFACRLVISKAGVAVYTGKKGNKLVDDFTWKRFIDCLEVGKKRG